MPPNPWAAPELAANAVATISTTLLIDPLPYRRFRPPKPLSRAQARSVTNGRDSLARWVRSEPAG